MTCPVFNPDVGCDSPPGQSCLSTTCNSSNAQIGDCECAEDPNIDVLTDSKLRFELLDEDIYFWQDNVGWANNGWFCGAGTDCPPNNNNFPLEAVYNLDKYGVQGRLNVFVVGDISNGFRGCGMGYAGERIAHVTMLGLFERIFVPNGDGQRASKAFIHEVGHFMGLHHTNLNWQTNLFPDATGVLGGDDNDTGCPCRNGDNTSNNIMNSIDSRVSGYLSPLQVGHVHRHLLAGWRSKVLKVEWDQSKTIIITDNPVVWDVGKVVCGDVIIKPGAKLTIKCKVIMPPDGRIVVEQGGQLIVDGGLITIANPEGGEYWRGIEVWGTPTAPQNNTSVQGRLTLINKATLEYAKTAVRLSHPQWASVNTGGRVWAFDAVFNNNNRSVAFHKYDFQNSSFFSNCQFLVNDDYSYPTVGSQITMWGVKNISYSRCTIRYERTVPEHDFLLVRGIHSLDAGFQVNQGLFENLQIGISAGDAADVPKYSVGNETIFKRCGRGIHNNAVNYFTIQDNIFQEIGYYEGDLADDGLHYEGVFLASGSGFRLRTNTFEGSYADNSEGTVGICAENTGGEVNKIENNTFDDLSLGLDGVGLNNDEIDPIFGLKFECNTSLVETGHDYFITPPGVATIQGSSQLAAGNNFDPSNNFLVFGEDINNLAANAHIDYFWFNANPPHQNPIDVVEVTPIQIFNSEGENDCDYDNDGGGNDGTFTDADLDNKKSQFYNERDEYYNKKNQLNSLIDGGDTDALVTLVKTAPSSNTMLVRDELLNHSPYLSNVVIREVINRTDLFPSSIMTEILAANPDEIRGKSMLLIAETEGGLSSSELDMPTKS